MALPFEQRLFFAGEAPKIDIGVIINGFGIGIARRSTSRSSPHSIVGDIRRRPVSPNYDVHTRDLTA